MMFRNDERQTICKFEACRLNLRNLHPNLAQEFAVFELRGSKGSTNAAWKLRAPRKSSTESDSVFPNTPASIRLNTICPTSSEAAIPQYSKTVVTMGPNSLSASCLNPSSNSPASTCDPV